MNGLDELDARRVIARALHDAFPPPEAYDEPLPDWDDHDRDARMVLDALDAAGYQLVRNPR